MKHYKYHWFWGLLYARQVNSPNMWDEMLKLKDREQYDQCKQTLDRIQRYPRLIRWAYWLFNIEEYTQQFYKFKLYVAYDYFKQRGSNAMADEDDVISRTSNPVTTWFWGPNLEIKEDEFKDQPEWSDVNPELDFYSRWVEPMSVRYAWVRKETLYVANFLYRKFWAKPEPKEEDIPEKTMDDLYNMPLDNGEKAIRLKWYMVDDLRCLGLEKNAHERLTWTELRQAYYCKAREYHPDKKAKGCVEDNDPFSTMRTAYEWLCKVFDQGDDVEMLYIARRVKSNKENKAKKRAERKAEIKAKLKAEMTPEMMARIKAEVKAEVLAEHKEELAELRALLEQAEQQRAANTSLLFFSASKSSDTPDSSEFDLSDEERASHGL